MIRIHNRQSCFWYVFCCFFISVTIYSESMILLSNIQTVYVHDKFGISRERSPLKGWGNVIRAMNLPQNENLHC